MFISSLGSALPHTSIRLLFRVCACLLLPIANQASAGVSFHPHADVNYEHNSNLFFAPDDQLPAITPVIGQPRFDDSYIYYGGGLDVIGTLGEDKLSFTSEVRRYAYDHFSQLDRNDQLYSLMLDWTANSKIFGKAVARYDQHQTPLADINTGSGTTLTQIDFTDIERVATVSANYQMTTKWMANAEMGYSRKSGPLTIGQDYELQQAPAKLSVKYGSKAQLTVGASVDFNSGKYIQADGAPSFRSTQYQLLLDYSFSPRTSLSAAVGYSKYTQLGLNSSANVGSLSFNQQLTGKTKYFIRYDRTLDTYATTQGSQLGTTITGGLTWQALRRVALSGSYGVTKADISAALLNPGVVNVYGDPRQDKIKNTTASINYEMFRWLAISPYYRYQVRTSSSTAYNYKSRIYGATITTRYR